MNKKSIISTSTSDLIKEDRNKYIFFINDNINELKSDYRKHILKYILSSNILNEKIIEKGNGTQIRYDDLNDSLILYIYNYIKNVLESSEFLF